MREQEALRTRLSLLSAPGGVDAGIRWVARKLLRVDAYTILARRLATASEPSTDVWSRDAFDVVTAANIDDVEPALLRQLDQHNGCPCAATVAQGGRIYVLKSANGVACQARVEFGGMRTDTPLPMIIRVGEHNAFLSYLHTSLAERRTGAARKLLGMTVKHLTDEGGWTYCVCHVQATNVRSLNAFRSAGWEPIASMWTTRSRLLRVSPVTRGLGVSFHAEPIQTRAS